MQDGLREEALRHFGLPADTKRVVVVIGGSLGALSINESIGSRLAEWAQSGCRPLLARTGKGFEAKAQELLKAYDFPVYSSAFIQRMDLAYAVADVVVSRAGASSISELCFLGKPTILVPSPNVAEDHQTHNALALVEKDAALYVKDSEAYDELMPLALKTVSDEAQLEKLSHNVRQLAHPDAASRIADEVIRLAEAAQGAQ